MRARSKRRGASAGRDYFAKGLTLGLMLATLTFPSVAVAAAAAPPTESAASLLTSAEEAEAHREFRAALDRYRLVVDRHAASPEAARAAVRISALEHRSEGNFGPLTRLERIRTSLSLADDPFALRELAGEASRFPDGPVRAETRLFAAAALTRVAPSSDGVSVEVSDWLRKASTDPAADPDTAHVAGRMLIEGLLRADRHAEARSEMAHLRLDPEVRRRLGGAARRPLVRAGALATLGLTATIVSLAAFRRFRARAPLVGQKALLSATLVRASTWAAFMAFGATAIARHYEPVSSLPFVALALATALLVVIARLWAQIGSPRALARTGRALLSACAVFAAAFLLLEAIEPSYLEGFGL